MALLLLVAFADQLVEDLVEHVQRLVGQAGSQIGKMRGEQAVALVSAEASEWLDVGTANMWFHRAIVALANSRRMTETARQVLAELRLAFHVMSSHREFHEPYLHRNRKIYHLLAAGDTVGAAKVLDEYLDAAEAQLLAAYASAASDGSSRPTP